MKTSAVALAMSLLVDQTKDSLDTNMASKTTDGWLSDALDVITKYLAMTLGASRATLSKTTLLFTYLKNFSTPSDNLGNTCYPKTNFRLFGKNASLCNVAGYIVLASDSARTR